MAQHIDAGRFEVKQAHHNIKPRVQSGSLYRQRGQVDWWPVDEHKAGGHAA
jgi:hypothetical protein